MSSISDVLITGDGFLAYNLHRHLRSNAEGVRVWNFTLHNGQDIRDYAAVERAVDGKQLVIHTAALTHVQDSLCGNRDLRTEFIHVNYLGTFNVLEACRQSTTKLIYISSSEVYGSNVNPGSPQDENHPLRPQASTYAVSKAAADHECRVAYECFGQDVVIVRPFNLYGYSQAVDKLIPRFLGQAMRGEPLTVHGHGNQRRDFVFAADCAQAIWAAREFPAGTIVNVGTETSFSVLDVAQLVQSVVERRYARHVAITHVAARPNDLPELCGSYAKLNAMCGWQPSQSLNEGIESVMDWYFANGPVPPPQSELLAASTLAGRRRHG